MEFIDPKLSEYCQNHSGTESELLARMVRETHLEVFHPRMLSGHLQGRFLSMISQLMAPKHILEIGTYTGYSGICLAEGLQADGKLITIDRNMELASRAKKYFEASGYGQKIEFISGDATQVLPTLNQEFDLIFIDADKANYPLYLDLVLPKIRKGGLLIADNVLWNGKVVEPLHPKDKDTAAILEFNRKVNESKELENVLLPIRDGLMMMRKL